MVVMIFVIPPAQTHYTYGTSCNTSGENYQGVSVGSEMQSMMGSLICLSFQLVIQFYKKKAMPWDIEIELLNYIAHLFSLDFEGL